MLTVTIPNFHFFDYIDRVELVDPIEIVGWKGRQVIITSTPESIGDLMEDAEYYATESEYASYLRAGARALVRSLVKQGVPRENPKFGPI